jgi:nicotinate-nucleotide adenylyltransferase
MKSTFATQSAPAEGRFPALGGHWCLFGGSFDPVHGGHVLLAQQVLAQTGAEKVVFLPCRQSPHKLDHQPAPPALRVAMLRLALASLGAQAEISTWELDRPPPSYSWETVAHFQEILPPGLQLSWLMGADQWAKLTSWARPEFLREHLHFLVFPRGEEPIQPRAGWRHTVIEARHPGSSTLVREAVAQQKWEKVAEMVGQPILQLIREERLFSGSKSE